MMLDGLWANAQEVKPPVKKDAKPKADEKPPVPVTCGVIGLGDQGRDIVRALAALPGADVRAVCDTYDGVHKRAQERAPRSVAVTDYRKILDDRGIQSVFVATPTHKHKDIVLAALQAGKHVYCEAPLAHTVDDARAIAGAAAKSKQIFVPGLQRRLNHLEKHVYGFFKTGSLGKLSNARASFSKKTTWRKAAASNERQDELNWRLNKAVSTGLMGEVGIHQLDIASWFLRQKPVSITGMGGIMAWADGRQVPDTVQAVVEYPNGFRLLYTATTANSFEAGNDVFQGTDAAVMLRNDRAWLFKESDAPNLGWEVYATKENIGSETGIALVANATKLLDQGLDPSENKDAYTKGPLYYGCEAFLNAIRGTEKATAGPLEGLEATIVGIKANEAVVTNSKVMFKKEWFSLA
jgi:predicted dehydrogenase